MKEHTIIPMKFGTFVSDNDEVREVLKRGYPQFKELVSTTDGKIELDVAATWNDLNSIIRGIGEEDKEIREFKTEVAKSPPNEALQARIKMGMMIVKALGKRREKEEAHIINSLQELAADFQKHQVMDDKMILNCAFLLDKSKEKEFDQTLNELDKRFNEEMNFKCVGPLPPYSFGTIELKKVGRAEINEARQLLGLNEEATIHEIKETYRKMTLKFHPDNNPADPNLKKQFGDIAKAYKLLSDYCQQASLDSKHLTGQAGQNERYSFSALGARLPDGQGSASDRKETQEKDFISIDILKV